MDESAEYIVQHEHEPNAPSTEAMLRQMAELQKKSDEDISYSDVPELSDAELAEFRHRSPQFGRLRSDLTQELKKAS